MGQVGWCGCGLDRGAIICDVVLGAFPRGVVCGYAGGVGGIVECGLRCRRGGEEFPMDVGFTAAGC